MANVYFISHRTYTTQAQTYTPAHSKGDLILAAVVSAAGAQPDLTSTGGTGTWKKVLEIARTGPYGDRYMTVKYKIATANLGDWTETINTGGTGGTGLASTVMVFGNAKGIGGSGYNITGTSSTNMYTWNGPLITMKKSDGSSIIVCLSSGYSQWGVSLAPLSGTEIASGQGIAASYRNSIGGVAATWQQSGGAPFEWAMNADIEITNSGASPGFFRMF